MLHDVIKKSHFDPYPFGYVEYYLMKVLVNQSNNLTGASYEMHVFISKINDQSLHVALWRLPKMIQKYVRGTSKLQGPKGEMYDSHRPSAT